VDISVICCYSFSRFPSCSSDSLPFHSFLFRIESPGKGRNWAKKKIRMEGAAGRRTVRIKRRKNDFLTNEGEWRNRDEQGTRREIQFRALKFLFNIRRCRLFALLIASIDVNKYLKFIRDAIRMCPITCSTKFFFYNFIIIHFWAN